MKKLILALMLVCATTVAYAQPPGAGDPPSPVPGIRQVEGPVLVTCPIIGVRLRCSGCYRQEPELGYYSGGPSATFHVEVVPMYVISTPLWVEWHADDSLQIWFTTQNNDTGLFRTGRIDIGDQHIDIVQESLPLGPVR